MLDAVNLAWKLAAVIAGWAPAALLDTYQGALTRWFGIPRPVQNRPGVLERG